MEARSAGDSLLNCGTLMMRGFAMPMGTTGDGTDPDPAIPGTPPPAGLGPAAPAPAPAPPASEKPALPWPRRARTWVLGSVLSGLSLVIVGAITHGAGLLGNAVLPPKSPAAVVVPAQTGSAQAGSAPTGEALQVKAEVDAGLGCGSNGMVYPAARTPGLDASTTPSTGPTHDGKTWEKAPAAFGAVAAGPVQLYLYLTGPRDHAVSVTGLRFRVYSRKPQVAGTWLNVTGGCGAGGDYHYGVFDLDRPAPYQVPITGLPADIRADALKFPYFTSANSLDDFSITVRSEHCDCTWDAVLTWIDGTASRSYVINNRGKPFESTSVTGLTGTAWVNPGESGTGKWLPQKFNNQGLVK
jgi:hypothetical protein